MARKVEMNIEHSALNENAEEFTKMFAQGKRVQVKHGEDVMVDQIWKDIYRENQKETRDALIQKKPMIIDMADEYTM